MQFINSAGLMLGYSLVIALVEIPWAESMTPLGLKMGGQRERLLL